jgi:molybdopterin converting factor subunit 1
MNIQIRFFAYLKDKTNLGQVVLEINPGTKVSDLKQILKNKYPDLETSLDNVITSINRNFAGEDEVIPDQAEVAFFPPVSGGSHTNDFVELTEEEIQVHSVIDQMAQVTTGGISFFTGIVRGKTVRGKSIETRQLYYEAYPEMAVEKMLQIVKEIKSQWAEIEQVTIIQRTGKLNPGEISVLIACSASHRDEGIFEAVRYGIDRLKEIVPVWKKEVTIDGEEWVEGTYVPKPGE